MDREKTWICPKCGTVNPDEYEVCYNCGNIVLHENREKQKSMPPEPGKTAPAAPQRSSVRKAPTGKRGPKKAIIAVASVLLVLLVVLFAVGEVSHTKAKAFAEEDDYASAIAAAKMDIFHGDFREKQLVERGIELFKQDKFDSAIACLEQFPENETAAKYLDDAIYGRDFESLEEARDILDGDDDNKYSKAAAALETITHPDIDTSEYFNWAYIGLARESLEDAAALNDVRTQLEKVTGRQDIEQALEVIGYMERGDYISAARLAAATPSEAKHYDDGIDAWRWERAILDRIGSYSTPEELLQYAGCENAFVEDVDFTQTSGTIEIARVVNQSLDYLGSCLVVSAEDLARCGNDRNGKILVVWEVRNYDEKITEYMIDGVAMQALPEDRFPTCLEEVGVVVRIGVSGEKEGWYNVTENGVLVGSIDAVRERGSVSAKCGFNGSSLYSSGTYWGPTCPNTISRYTYETEFGGLPMNELSVAAYTAIRKAING